MHSTSYRPDQVHPTAFLAPNATVLGDVTIAAGASVWFGAVVRGDTEAIRIGERTNIQDLCVLHADAGSPCVLGSGVTVGHAAIVHGARVEDDVMIGMRAVVLNGAVIGAGSIIAAGALIPEGKQIPPNSLVMGMPGKVVREVSEEDRARIRAAAEHYVRQSETFKSKCS